MAGKRTLYKDKFVPIILISGMALLLLFAYNAISRNMAKNNLTQVLREEVNQKGIMMEDYLQPEIALTKKLASSPTIVRFFKNPNDAENRERAFAELRSYKEAFSSHIVFWANDVDKEFWNDMKLAYVVDPSNPDDYWYNMTLHKTDVYNFNINYNADMDMTCLWLNAVVRDEKGNAIGMAGTGIELDNFINKCYETLRNGIHLYFFNDDKEITGAQDKKLLLEKASIKRVYNGSDDFDALMREARDLASNSNGQHTFRVNAKEYGVMRYLSSYGWYLIATAPTSAGKSSGNMVFLIICIALEIVFSVFVLFISKLQAMMRKATSASNRLIDETEDLTSSSKENAETAQNQSAAVKEIVATMEDNTALSENISKKIKDVTSLANKTSEDVADGVQYLEENVTQLGKIAEANQTTIEGIKALGDKIAKIWDIVTLINAVADQAKIIAFNAELEASSAGEAGHNFHIVATEIRRLADGIIDGTKEIKESITEIQKSSDSLILMSESGTERIKEGVDNAKSLENRFSSIKNASEITAGSADEITTIISQQAVASEQILISLKQISGGVDKFKEATAEISVASEKLSSIAQELRRK
ncbi:methyl-accepting chemotaxis protein [Treponema saccharophilum]|uniref:methyl-accepting chemotaxis protein n=1 Tax=Treponema saccharophilum TaxID=165 RepID=UPI00386F5D2B